MQYSLSGGLITIVVAMAPTLGQTVLTFVLVRPLRASSHLPLRLLTFSTYSKSSARASARFTAFSSSVSFSTSVVSTSTLTVSCA